MDDPRTAGRPTYLTDPEVEALLNGPDHSAGHTYDTALPAR
jgi:hypothetical protein